MHTPINNQHTNVMAVPPQTAFHKENGMKNAHLTSGPQPLATMTRAHNLAAVLLSLFALFFLTSRPAAGQDKVLDDFSTGPGTVSLFSPGSITRSQTGATIAGGSRTVTLSLSSTADEFQQSTSVQILPSRPPTPSAFVWSNG